MASVASTYARAFADVVLSARLDSDRSIAELRTIASLLAESSELRRVWENPAIPAEQKRKVLDVVAERDGISKQVRNLVAVLIDHRRVHFLEAIIAGTWRCREARVRGTGCKADGEKSSSAVWAGCVASGRRGGPDRQHDL